LKKIKKLNLGFLKIEKKIDQSKLNTKPKFIHIEKVKKENKPIRANIESNIDISVVPKGLENVAEKQEVIVEKKTKPKRFVKLINEINIFFSSITIFNLLLSMFILFLFNYIVLMPFKIGFYYTFILPSVYTVVCLFIKFKENNYLKVEKEFPRLNEKIRTAVDNIYLDNEVVKELRKEVFLDIREVDYASFFSSRRTSLKIFMIVFLCFSIIFLGQFNLEFDLGDLSDKVFSFVEGGKGNNTGIVSDIISAATGGEDSEIYGEEYLATLGQEEVTFNMNKVGYEINMNDVKDPQERDFEDSLFPEDVGISESNVYSEKEYKDRGEIIKNYFISMANE
jgi:hypothetical protein